MSTVESLRSSQYLVCEVDCLVVAEVTASAALAGLVIFDKEFFLVFGVADCLRHGYDIRGRDFCLISISNGRSVCDHLTRTAMVKARENTNALGEEERVEKVQVCRNQLAVVECQQLTSRGKRDREIVFLGRNATSQPLSLTLFFSPSTPSTTPSDHHDLTSIRTATARSHHPDLSRTRFPPPPRFHPRACIVPASTHTLTAHTLPTVLLVPIVPIWEGLTAFPLTDNCSRTAPSHSAQPVDPPDGNTYHWGKLFGSGGCIHLERLNPKRCSRFTQVSRT